MTIDAASKRQIRAADPGVSTWLSANAGSGKTRVLTDRVARLLLTGVSPQNILCLTYTKAAASEMQNRLFKRLGEWSMLDDVDLLKALDQLGVPALPNAEGLAYARTLFARAIETPGGLRIQTIHSFCASLLRRFPLESAVSPIFREMDERAAKRLREDIIEAMAAGEHADLLGDLAQYYSGDDFTGLAFEAIRHRESAARAVTDAEVWRWFDLPDGFSESDLLSAALLGDERELFATLIPELLESTKKTDHAAAKKLAALNMDGPSIADLVQLFPVFLYGAKAKAPFGAKVDAFPTNEVRLANPALVELLNQLMKRVEIARENYCRLIAAKKTRVFYKFAAVFLPLYEAKKSARGWLDFDDLITRAQRLLSDPAAAQWVLFRLDGGLDHILVDEAQDTSPAQWKVVELLAREFSVGHGARPDVVRTIFVVGDLKQSIYSFQGADPRAFDAMRQHFSSSLAAAQLNLAEHSLEHSFRSSPAILALVDAVFPGSDGMGVGVQPKHVAFHKDMPGRVDLWAVVEKTDADEEKEWFDPTNKLSNSNPRIILAERIAEHIETLEKTGSIPDNSGNFRRIRYDDFLVLVQSRSELFHQIIRACKSLKLPIAGADRLKIGGELAVRDLQALLTFLALSSDSLSLAAALRSPLFGISEAELFQLAHGRPENDLWPALVRERSEFRTTFDMLTDLRNHADFQSPFELLERILTRHDGRGRLLARLGPEAEDGIEALLSQAIIYESTETASLTGFLVWLGSDGVEIKRQSDNLSGRIRVMTTHGAKGLESPIVILPDTGDRRPPQKDEIIPFADGQPIWRPAADQRPRLLASALAKLKTARNEEFSRLLYVALTRAEKWLIVCGSGDIKDGGDSWYRLVQAGMAKAGATPSETPAGPGLRSEHGEWRNADTDAKDIEKPGAPRLPKWTREPAVSPEQGTSLMSPSNLGGDKSLAGEAAGNPEFDAAGHGRRVHRLLEYLPRYPQNDWPALARQLLSDPNDLCTAAEINAALTEATPVINNPKFSHIFAPGVLTEVAISANLHELEGMRIHGTIDRLLVEPSRVLIVDYKSNRVVPKVACDTPQGILRQMAAYLGAVNQLYPDHRIELEILWTYRAILMPLSHDIVMRSLGQPPHLDDTEPDP